MKAPGVPVRIMAAACLLALGLVGLVVREGMARAQGREVWLEIAGYDPRSLLSGHYVQFQLRSEQPSGTPCPPGSNDFASARQWVALRRVGDRHVPSGAAASREEAARLGDVAARGRLACDGPEAPGGDRPAVVPTPVPPREPTETVITAELGVDRAHFDQRQAEALEQILRTGAGTPPPAFAVVSVGRDGKARLKGLVIGGQRMDLSWF